MNTVLKSEKKEKELFKFESLINDVYLLPKWEKIKDFIFDKKNFIFADKKFNVDLFRKFSIKNNVEKYMLKDNQDKVMACLDLRVYKDSVYIINLNIENSNLFEQCVEVLLQTAAEKALYNTTDKKVNINLSFPVLIKNKIKKILLSYNFIEQENQSEYEKNMFGSMFTLNIENSSILQKKIRQMPILINK